MAQQSIDLGPAMENKMLTNDPSKVDTIPEAIAKIVIDLGVLYPLISSESVTTTNVITAAESGKTFFLTHAGGFTSTLPAPAAGLRYKFVVAVAPTTAYIVTTTSGSDLLYGTLLDIVGEQVAFAARDKVNFVANTSLVGDSLDVISDGTNWYCRAFSAANGGISTSVT